MLAGDLGHGAVPAAEMLPAHAVSVLDRTGNSTSAASIAARVASKSPIPKHCPARDPDKQRAENERSGLTASPMLQSSRQEGNPCGLVRQLSMLARGGPVGPNTEAARYGRRTSTLQRPSPNEALMR